MEHTITTLILSKDIGKPHIGFNEINDEHEAILSSIVNRVKVALESSVPDIIQGVKYEGNDALMLISINDSNIEKAKSWCVKIIGDQLKEWKVISENETDDYFEIKYQKIN